jgi:hypothetical protein
MTGMTTNAERLTINSIELDISDLAARDLDQVRLIPVLSLHYQSVCLSLVTR